MPVNSYGYTGGYQYFTVPAGVTQLTLSISGAGSGSSGGGHVTGHAAVSAGQRIQIVCGQAGAGGSGANGGAHAWGGGGAGGDANNGSGGDGGGGYSMVRRDGGTIFGVAGGAGGASGDNGAGGEGGSTTGGSGSRGTSGSGTTGAATGGTQSQGGNAGTSSSGSEFNGHNAADTALNAYGGTGGGPSQYHSHGGGGGGGGWHQGGGGQAASYGFAPGGGGGGGSNYTGGMSSAASYRGTGGTGGGNVTITYVASAPASQPPNTPTGAKVNGHDETPDLTTKSTGAITITATISDPDDDDVRMLVRLSRFADFASYTDYFGEYHTSPGLVGVSMSGLSQNTHYYVRLYTQDNHGLYSVGYNTLDFWTNRFPDPPGLTAPPENSTVPALSSPVFTWTFTDPDAGDVQTGFELRYRIAETITAPAGPWTVVSQPTVTFPTWTLNPGQLKGSTFYEWSVRTKDSQQAWGDWAVSNSFYVSSASSPPRLLNPVNDLAVDINQPGAFAWAFVDPDPADSQTKADVRYRIVGQPDSHWVTLFGTTGSPGVSPGWTFPPESFVLGYHYEWQARTYDLLGGLASDWSTSGTFWTTGTPGEAVAGVPAAPSAFIKGTLGCGEYRVFAFFQGGERLAGEITPLVSVNFTRVRDDISTATIVANGQGQDCGGFFGSLRCWIHEVVIFRKEGDGQFERCWEGPVTLLTYQADVLTIEAQDVMVYAFRRILRQGYNDSYQLLNGQQVGLPSVVDRAQRILMNALAPYDPNILKYLTAYRFADDAKESRVVPDYSRYSWEEVDDMASNAGLDYTTIGRRILLWDTHRPIGRLPELRDGDFSDAPIISEYGMQLCNYAAVTNGSGVWGAASPVFGAPPDTTVISGGFNHILHPGSNDPTIIAPAGQTPFDSNPFRSYGPIEMLASAYGEAAAGTEEVLTPSAKAALVSAMTDQAKRNINDRWPTPIQVRVPDNSTLSPDCNITFDQLVPGVWVPLRSDQSMREVVQWQKLDSIGVSWTAADQEKITVVLSPAPNAGQDPDVADAAAGA